MTFFPGDQVRVCDFIYAFIVIRYLQSDCLMGNGRKGTETDGEFCLLCLLFNVAFKEREVLVN